MGPFPRDLKYTVVAERLGYVLAPLDGKPGSFTAKKLASVVVRMVDEQGTPLPGVLVSLSGALPGGAGTGGGQGSLQLAC